MRFGDALQILYVENDIRFATAVIENFLDGHEVSIAPSLCAARELLARPWDVILVDYDLNDGKGDALVYGLRAAGDATAVIAVSARAWGNRNIQCAGADAVCPKANIKHIPEMIEYVIEKVAVGSG